MNTLKPYLDMLQGWWGVAWDSVCTAVVHTMARVHTTGELAMGFINPTNHVPCNAPDPPTPAGHTKA